MFALYTPVPEVNAYISLAMWESNGESGFATFEVAIGFSTPTFADRQVINAKNLLFSMASPTISTTCTGWLQSR